MQRHTFYYGPVQKDRYLEIDRYQIV